jgi:hypothetical protein
MPRPTRLYGIAAAPWRAPELIRDPAGRTGISLRQHPQTLSQEAGPRDAMGVAGGRREWLG